MNKCEGVIMGKCLTTTHEVRIGEVPHKGHNQTI